MDLFCGDFVPGDFISEWWGGGVGWESDPGPHPHAETHAGPHPDLFPLISYEKSDAFPRAGPHAGSGSETHSTFFVSVANLALRSLSIRRFWIFAFLA